ncbi:OmpL47-type beta-barrel domain-containing protein [Paenibacillus sp. Soil522]|uniref:OmpL47-type beta-barrel domain-containing protein n=1 Tax=Paenibacillus sp. Soil522 TaxID=1736388 RepID=UPI0006F83D22|nr:alginate lyase family protein [Paenibacillus sp. Soil522]KRE46161.1 hypothetical protein ASG81_12230 [Paenibacillus sp. Soil522]
MKKHLKQVLSLLLCVPIICMQLYTLFLGSTAIVAAAAGTASFPAVQDAFVSNFGTQADSLGINLIANKLIYGKFRHTYLKFDLSSIETNRYNIDEMKMILSFRKTHAPNELVFTESEPTLRNSGAEWTVNNLTYNARPNDIAESPVVTRNVTSTGEENLSIDLSTIFRFALSNGRKVVSIHLTTTRVNENAVAASEMYSSRNTSGYSGPSLAVTLDDPIVNNRIVDKTALSALIAKADQLIGAEYTAASWEVFAGALNNAKEVSRASATQAQVDQALLSLQTAMDNLAELTSKITGPNMGNYFNNSKTASMIFKMKNGEGKYVKVDPITEKLSLTANAAEASTFALYVLDYFATVYHEEPEVGATRTAYSIKSLDNDKYLTIQNYFTAEEFLSNTHRYFNILSGAQSGTSTDRTFEVKASASIPSWNERFYVDHYVKSGYYRIWSHLSTMRDDSGFNRINVKMTDDSMQSTGTAAQNTEYRFYFEEVTGRDLLEVSQEVSGDDAELFWRPVNGDTNPENYIIVGTDADVVYADGLMRVTVSDLSVGIHEYTVEYNGSGYQAIADVKVRIFNHPGILYTIEDLERMKLRVQEKAEPWYSDYQRLLHSVTYDLSSFDYETTVFSNVGRGGAPSDSGNIGYFEKGGNAAYFNALQWVITGDYRYAERASDILGKWAKALKVIDGRDRILGAGINAYKYASAAEIIRYYNGGYDGYSDADFKSLQDMMLNVVYPVIQDAAAPMLANGNWDAAAIVSMISIGVLCDNTEIFNRAMALYQDIHVNGSIFTYVHESGQTMETGRDQAHAMLAIGYMAEICLIAYNQDVDLYSLYDNRLAKAFEYSAKYNLYSKELYGEDVPFVAMPNVFGDTGRGYYGAGFDRENNGLNKGELRPVFDQALALYTKVGGVDMTWTARAAAAARPQAMVHFDNLNFGTLTYYNGEPLNSSGPYFQMRTRWEPLYQRNWSIVDGQRVAETVNSYYDINENGELVTSIMKKDAPFYQLVTNDDGTYSVRLVKTNTYLSVKDDTVESYNVIKADATEIGENEKFILRSSGVGPFFLVSPKFDNRIVYQHAAGSGSGAVLTLRLGTKKLSQIADIPNISTNERLIFMYNTEDIALNSSDDAAPETTATAEGEAQNDWYRSAVVVDFAATDEISGVAVTYYRVDDGDVASGRQAVIETEGVHTVTYWSVDRAGNAEEAKSLSVSVDLTAPSIIFDVADGTEFTVDQLVAISCDATDELSGIARTTCELIKVTAYELGLGEHTFSASASDQAGHATNASITVIVTVDYDSLARLTRMWFEESGHGDVAASLIEKLDAAKASTDWENAKAKEGQLGAFVNQAKAQSGKAITAEQADLLVSFAAALM